MKRFFKHLFAITGIGMAIGLSIFIMAITDGMTNIDDVITTLWVSTGFAILAYLISSFMPKFGGVLMILFGISIFGTLGNIGIIATIPLSIAGIISWTTKKRQKSGI